MLTLAVVLGQTVCWRGFLELGKPTSHTCLGGGGRTEGVEIPLIGEMDRAEKGNA